MSYWLYFQTGINLALAGACVYLYMQQRRSRAQGNWKQELGPLVETLGELLVEVDRLAVDRTKHKPEQSNEVSEIPASATMVTEMPPQASKNLPTQEALLKASTAPSQAAPTEVATEKPSLVVPVLDLASQGLNAGQIAERLGRPIGEVTLVLGLRSSFAASA